jgi:hypothetical protein
MGPTSAKISLAKINDEDHRTVVTMIARYAKEVLLIPCSSTSFLSWNLLIS